MGAGGESSSLGCYGFARTTKQLGGGDEQEEKSAWEGLGRSWAQERTQHLQAFT